MVIAEFAFSDNPARFELRPAHQDRLTRLHEAGGLNVTSIRELTPLFAPTHERG